MPHASSAAISPAQAIHWDAKGSRFKHMPKPPLRWLIAGPSGAGKGVTMQNLLLNHYRGAFERIYAFSPTAELDTSTWSPVRKYIQDGMGVDLQKEPAFFEDFDPAVVQRLINKHSEVVRKQKERKETKVFNALIIIDDYADEPQIVKKQGGSILNKLFLSGRHHGISTWVATQKLSMISVPIRVNATALICFRVRSQKEYETIEDEVTALLDRKTFRQVWKAATSEPYSFLTIFLNAQTLNETFMVRFEHRITFTESEESE